MRTLKQIVHRINQLATSHQQINQVGFGSVEDLQNLVTTGLIFPMCFIELKDNIDISRDDKLQRFNFSLYFFDQHNVIEGARSNVIEVKSDLVSIATDLLAMLQRDVDYDVNQDWAVSQSSSLSAKEYQLTDLCIGVELPVQVGLRYAADRCQVPMTEPDEILVDMKIISNFKYSVTAETETLTLPLLKKEILLFSLGNSQLEVISTGTPNANQVAYNGLTGVFTFGAPIYAGTFIQILNRPL